MEDLRFDYYYDREPEQYQFYRIPKLLITDARFHSLSSESKLLYGLMLDRMSLSMKNGWMDEDRRVFIIYTNQNICEDLCCGKDKATKLLSELDSKKGIGLIERKRRGLGKPDIIYVKNFFGQGENPVKKSAARPHDSSECGKSGFWNAEKSDSGVRENRCQEYGITAPNNTDIIQTELNHTDYDHLILSAEKPGSDVMDGLVDRNTDQLDALLAFVRDNILYDWHMDHDPPGDRACYMELYEVIASVLTSDTERIRIGDQTFPSRVVWSRLMKLRSEHLEYVRDCIRNYRGKIARIDKYMLAALYRAPETITTYYQQLANHDMYGEEGV